MGKAICMDDPTNLTDRGTAGGKARQASKNGRESATTGQSNGEDKGDPLVTPIFGGRPANWVDLLRQFVCGSRLEP